MTVPFYIKGLFYILVFIAFVFLMAYMRKGFRNAQIDQNIASRFMQRVFIGLTGWLLVLAVLSSVGFFMNFQNTPPRIFLTVVGSVMLMVLLLSSKKFKLASSHVPLHWIPYFQAFRVPLEITLWMLMLQKFIPIQMTFEGYNFDIVPAILGPIVGYLVFKMKALPKWVAVVWNFTGIGFVLTIVTIAVLSTPSPLRYFENDPANEIIAYFPFVWLPGFLVPAAIFFHIVHLKELLKKKD